MNNYKTLVAEAADKYATEKGLLNGFERNSFKLVMQSPEAVELIEQIARAVFDDLECWQAPDAVWNDEFWAKFMGGEDE
jgi:hypothetical protein